MGGCEEDTFEFQSIYFNSFEKDIDTVGWEGGYEFYYGTTPFGGARSLYISGGYSMPHAYYQLGPFDEDNYVTIRCWGKIRITLSSGGFVSSAMLIDMIEILKIN